MLYIEEIARSQINNTLAALKHRRGYIKMRGRIVLGVGGTAPDCAVSIDDMGQSVTSPEVELKL